MKKRQMTYLLMALWAMSFFNSSPAFSQDLNPKPLKQSIKTPDTSKELIEDKKSFASEEEEPRPRYESPSRRGIHQHGLGIGLGQTFLFGNYGKHGQDKITADLLYTYSASYSFDLLVNAHLSEHTDDNEKMKLMGLTSSFKGKFVEYDSFSPYFLGGLGFYAPKAKRLQNNKLEWSDQKVTFGLNFGAGIDLRLNEQYIIGVMTQVHWPFKVTQEEGTALKGYYMKLLLTGMYLF
jgi:hypothetical protein